VNEFHEKQKLDFPGFNKHLLVVVRTREDLCGQIRGTEKGSGVFVYAPQKLGPRLAIIHFSSRGGELIHVVSLIGTLIYGEQLVRIVGRCKE
jgi:RNA 3'-terminal phosphate cyclase